MNSNFFPFSRRPLLAIVAFNSHTQRTRTVYLCAKCPGSQLLAPKFTLVVVRAGHFEAEQDKKQKRRRRQLWRICGQLILFLFPRYSDPFQIGARQGDRHGGQAGNVFACVYLAVFSDLKPAASRYCHESGPSPLLAIVVLRKASKLAFCLAAFLHSRLALATAGQTRRRVRPFCDQRQRDEESECEIGPNGITLPRRRPASLAFHYDYYYCCCRACLCVCKPVARFGSRCSRDNISSRLRSVFFSVSFSLS